MDGWMENNLEDIVRGTYHMFTAVKMLGHQVLPLPSFVSTNMLKASSRFEVNAFLRKANQPDRHALN